MLTSPSLVQRYAFGGEQVFVSASSTYTDDPQDQAYAAFDANQRTTWISGATDTRPRLTIAWPGTRRLSSITVVRPAGATDLLPVQITGSAGQVRNVILGGPGRQERETVRFAPMLTSSLTLTFTADDGNGPVQITDVQIPGVQQLVAHPTAPLRLGCGSGPAIQVNGTSVATRVSGTVADILDSRPLAFTACSTVPMVAGRNLVTEPASDAFSVQAVTMIRQGAGVSLSRATPGPGSAATAVKTLSWTSARRVVQVSVGQPSYLIVNENFNAGWRAALHGRDLQPVRLDGWKQGWLLPAGSRGLVTLTYPPNTQYRLALFGGLAALFLIIVIAAVPLRRRGAATERPPVDASSPRRSAGVLACGLCLAVLLGLWIGGYPGAGLLPVLTLGFLAAIGYRARSGLARAAADPWLVAALLVVAAGGDAAGNELYAHGTGGVILTALSGVIPELCCLAAMARLIAALLASEQSGDPGTDRGQDRPRYSPEG